MVSGNATYQCQLLRIFTFLNRLILAFLGIVTGQFVIKLHSWEERGDAN